MPFGERSAMDQKPEFVRLVVAKAAVTTPRSAPVSPVSTVRPGSSVMSSFPMRTMSRMESAVSMLRRNAAGRYWGPSKIGRSDALAVTLQPVMPRFFTVPLIEIVGVAAVMLAGAMASDWLGTTA